MRRTIFSFVWLLLGGQLLFAQENSCTQLSLQQCVQMAVERNIMVRTARLDQEKSGLKKEEVRSVLLPKFNLSGNFQDNLKVATTVLPASFMKYLGYTGTEGVPVAMGTQYSSSVALSFSQVIFNKTALLALEMTRKSEAISALSVEKASEEIAAEVARLYFLTLTTSEQQKLIEGNIARAEKLKSITKITVDNGFGKQVDLDRVCVNLENYYTQLSNTKAACEQQLNLMKYMLNLPQDQPISLTDKADFIMQQETPGVISDFSNHVDIQLLESQQEINKLNQKFINSGYQPSLNLSGLFAYQGLKGDFKDYFNKESKWYPYSYFTVGLSVPVFDGFEKRSKSRQARIELEKTREKLESVTANLSMSYKNALNNYQNNKTNVIRQQQNLKLAEKVYDESSLKYKEGLATMSTLLQDEIGLSNAQAGYLNALYNFKDAEVKIMSLNGGIKTLFNK